MSKELREVLVARTRKPKARHHDSIMSAMNERLLMLQDVRDLESVQDHVKRFRDLFDELRRSLSNAKDAEE